MNSPGSDNSKETLDIVKNVAKNLFFSNSKVRVVVIWMWAGMNDAIHVQVQVVKLGDLVLLDDLENFFEIF